VTTDANANPTTDWNQRSVDEFGQTLRAFLNEHHPGRRPKGSRREQAAWQRAWSAALYDHGFAGPSWPAEYGGMDLDLEHQISYYAEIARARVPAHPGNGPSIAGPTIIRYGTDEQRAAYLPAMLRGDTIWAQGSPNPRRARICPRFVRLHGATEISTWSRASRYGAAAPMSRTGCSRSSGPARSRPGMPGSAIC
jgi:hypothetical protein